MLRNEKFTYYTDNKYCRSYHEDTMKWTCTVAQEDRQSIDLWCEDARNILLRRKVAKES